MRIVLIETAPPDSAGSMRRYASLLETALQNVPGLECRRVSLAPTLKQLQRVPRRLRSAVHHATIIWRAGRLARTHPAEIYHIVDGSHAYVARSLPKSRTIVTAHDVIPELQARGRFPLPPPGNAARWIIRTSLREVADSGCVMADSQSTKTDLILVAGVAAEQIHVVPLAMPPELLPNSDEQLPRWDARRQSCAPFLLHVGNNSFYKNRLGVVRIYDRIRRKEAVRLKFAGPPPDDGLRNLIHSLGMASCVDFVNNPDDAALISLYRSARLLVFPSLYEGFGWPPLEAMAWGCPVVCSENGSLAEVVDGAALTADASAEEELAEHCVSILQTRELAERMMAIGRTRAAEFSLEHFRERILAVYRTLADACGLSAYAYKSGKPHSHLASSKSFVAAAES